MYHQDNQEPQYLLDKWAHLAQPTLPLRIRLRRHINWLKLPRNSFLDQELCKSDIKAALFDLVFLRINEELESIPSTPSLVLTYQKRARKPPVTDVTRERMRASALVRARK